MKFQKNDRFRVKENGTEGTIVGTSFNSIYQEDEVYVIWDSFPEKGQCCYMAADADNIWEKIAKIKDATVLSKVDDDDMYGYVNQDRLPRGAGPGDFTKEEIKKTCDHKWVEVGFMHTKTVCYYCDTEKKWQDEQNEKNNKKD